MIDPAIATPRERRSGAHFYKCALQVNPFEYLRTNSKPIRFNTATDYNTAMVEACRNNGIHAIAVTDHYEIHTSVSLMDACRSNGISVFPGFEAKTKDGVHLLCLFDLDVTVEEIERRIGGCDIPSTRDASSTGRHDVLEFLEASKGWGAICIAAHVTAGGGLLRQLSKEPRVNAWKSPDLLACSLSGSIDDVDEGDRLILRNKCAEYSRKQPVAIINAKDVDDPEELSEPGTSCFLKMVDVSLEGLRQAFLDPESRVRLHGEEDTRANYEFVSMKWTGGFLDDTEIFFNPNLNVLLGGRGAGKSTVIESLRYVLRREPRDDSSMSAHRGIVRNVLREGTKVSLRIRSAQPSVNEYTIERTVPNPPVVLKTNGERTDLAPEDVFPEVVVCGQREISELTADAAGLARLLEVFLDPDPSLDDRQADLSRELAKNRHALLQARRELRATRDRLATLPGLEEQLERFRDAGFEDRLRERTLVVREESLLNSVPERLESLRALVSNLAVELPIDRAFLSERALEDLPGRAILNDLNPVLTSLSSDLEANAAEMERSLGKADRRIDEVRARWAARKTEVETTYQKILRGLGEGAVQGGELIRLREQIERLRPLRQREELSLQAESEHADRRQTLLREWQDLQSARLLRLQRAAKKLSRQLSGRVAIGVSPATDRSPVMQILREQVGGRLDSVEQALRRAEDFSLREFAIRCREGADALRKHYGITPSQALSVAGAPDEALMLIEEVDLGAQTALRLNTAPTSGPPQWKEIDQLSKGQKATAVLLLMLLKADGPLVVDQPEDDLDNRFISANIVPRLRAAKRERQFVLSTHNANIPVLGDAELILGLTAAGEAGVGSAQIRDDHRGSIDQETVKELIEELLEGGRTAFETRQRKYGF